MEPPPHQLTLCAWKLALIEADSHKINKLDEAMDIIHLAHVACGYWSLPWSWVPVDCQTGGGLSFHQLSISSQAQTHSQKPAASARHEREIASRTVRNKDECIHLLSSQDRNTLSPHLIWRLTECVLRLNGLLGEHWAIDCKIEPQLRRVFVPV